MHRTIYAAAAALLALAGCGGDGTPADSTPGPTAPAAGTPSPTPTRDPLAPIDAKLDVTNMMLTTSCDSTGDFALTPEGGTMHSCEFDGQPLEVAVFASQQQRTSWTTGREAVETGDECYPCVGSHETVLWAVSGSDPDAVREFAAIIRCEPPHDTTGACQ